MHLRIKTLKASNLYALNIIIQDRSQRIPRGFLFRNLTRTIYISVCHRIQIASLCDLCNYYILVCNLFLKNIAYLVNREYSKNNST